MERSDNTRHRPTIPDRRRCSIAKQISAPGTILPSMGSMDRQQKIQSVVLTILSGYICRAPLRIAYRTLAQWTSSRSVCLSLLFSVWFGFFSNTKSMGSRFDPHRPRRILFFEAFICLQILRPRYTWSGHSQTHSVRVRVSRRSTRYSFADRSS